MENKPQTCQIRLIKETDLQALEWDGKYKHFRCVYQQAYKEHCRGMRILLVAEVEGEVIGQLFVHLKAVIPHSNSIEPTGYLHSFRVRPDFRQRGVGSALIAEAERRLLGIQYRHAVIAVSKKNEAALRLYQKLGYRVYAEDPGEWSYNDERGQIRHVSDPSFLLQKSLA